MFVLWLARFCQLPYICKPMGKSLAFRIFIKSAVDQKNLKLGTVITWTISIVQKNVCCHSNMPGGIQFLGPFSKCLNLYIINNEEGSERVDLL